MMEMERDLDELYTETIKIVNLDLILTRLYGKDDEDSKNLIIDCAEVHFETHDLRNGNARYTLVSRIDFLEFLQDMRDDGHKITEEQLDLLRGELPASRGLPFGVAGVYINLEIV